MAATTGKENIPFSVKRRKSSKRSKKR